ncbi:MAG: BamA/TamA family outer membrane protein [Planctomycetes bacterium]|nr:BamA/TamA family outer membrane protein [Planctomycetota bacterium]
MSTPTRSGFFRPLSISTPSQRALRKLAAFGIPMLAFLFLSTPAPAAEVLPWQVGGEQEPANPPAAKNQEKEPRVIDSIDLIGAGDREAQIRAALSLRPGQPFQMEAWLRDVGFLWSRMRVRLESLEMEELPNNRARLIISCVAIEAFRRVLFLGHDESDLSRKELLLATGLTGAQSIDRLAMPRIQNDIVRSFQAKGFHFVEVTPEVVEEKDEVIFHIEQGDKVRVGEVLFVGNSAIEADKFVGTDLEGTVESSTGWFIFPGSIFSAETTVRNDIVALERLYNEYGYLEAKVSLKDREFYNDQSRVRLTYQIVEGPLFSVNSISIQPAKNAPDLVYDHAELTKLLQVEPGMPLEQMRLDRDLAAIRRYYGAKGHTAASSGVEADATFFSVTTEKLLAEGNKFDVIFRVHEGKPKHIREVLIFGNEYTQDRVIRREIETEPGDLADSSLAAVAHRRLLGSGYYLDPNTGQPYVDYRFLPTPDPDLVDLRFDVREGAGTGNMLFGGGISSNNGPFLSINLQKQNFDITDTPSSLGSSFAEILDGEAFTGGGQTLQLFLAPGSEFSTYKLSFFEPDLLGEHVSQLGFRTDIYKTYRYLRTHQEQRTGLGFTLSRRFGRYFSLFAGPRWEKIGVSDISSNVTPGIGLDSNYELWKHTLIAGTSYSTVQDRFSPVDSWKTRFELRQNGEFMGGDMDYIEADWSFGKYFGIWEDTLGRDWTLAFEGRARKAWSDLPVPYSERYWMGGTSTIRGFDYRGVGRTDEGFSIGGEASVNGSVELRFPIASARVREEIAEFQWARGAFFVDAGTYGNEFSDLEPLRVSAGFGVRIRLPMMPQFPIALDFGWPLASEDNDDDRVFHLNFGEF